MGVRVGVRLGLGLGLAFGLVCFKGGLQLFSSLFSQGFVFGMKISADCIIPTSCKLYFFFSSATTKEKQKTAIRQNDSFLSEKGGNGEKFRDEPLTASTVTAGLRLSDAAFAN